MKALQRCSWCLGDPLYQAYHDDEWGVPERDDRALFEKLILDGFQAGLSWLTILKKRNAFKQAFDGFEPALMAAYSPHKVDTLLTNKAIVRHRGKIEASITNAQAYLRLMAKQCSFAAFLWQFTGNTTLQTHWPKDAPLPATRPESVKMAKALKDAGFKFCGPTICYAFMQATGMVNDHAVHCFRHSQVAQLSQLS